MKKINICKAEPYHLDRIYEIERSCFRVPWTRELLLEEINHPDSIVLCAYFNGNLAGFCALVNICGEGHITNVAVDSKYRNKGVGTVLVKELLSWSDEKDIRAFTLEVRISNSSAIKLYEKFGFVSVGVRKKYYIDNNEDALIMWLNSPHIAHKESL